MAAPTDSQINQMTNFILNEAKDKAEEISAAALQDFSAAKSKQLGELQQTITQSYTAKVKKMETARAIEKSTAVNKSRLQKIRLRQDVLGRISKLAEEELSAKLKSESEMGGFLTKLIAQGLLMLVEDDVQVRCRAADDKIVSGIMKAAADEYSKIIQGETGATKTVKLSLASEKLRADGLGGVVLACQNGTITIDNTIDSRLGLVMEQAKPRIRKLLFDA